MSGRSEDEIERLANRLALLVSDTGEADNAGRAVGALARRLGLSGGDLKAIFLAGATAGASGGQRRGERRGDPQDVAALGRQLSAARHSLTLAEVAMRNAERERDALARENQTLQAALDQRRAGSQVGRIFGTVLLAAVLVGGLYTVIGPAFRAPAGGAVSATPEPPGTPFVRTAIAHPGGARLYAAPSRGSAIITTVPGGTRLTVRKLVVNVLVQWAEVDFAGRGGYVVNTEVDIP